ncbi:MAG: glycerophosphodiester phosphodiesterase [Actinomycetota bacterium]|nr:glycerophosphodiester phosphodiesterase [Actinomycetota bacterium]
MLILGHRGARAKAPDNTVAAFAAALRAGAAGSEFDVRLAADGMCVCAHDASLPDGRRICDVAAAEILAMNVEGPHGSREPFASLEDALRSISGAVVIAEIKNHPWDPCYDATHALAAAVAEALQPDSIVACFDPASLDRVRELRTDLRTAVTTGAAFDPSANLAAAIEGGHEICSVEHEAITEEFVRRAHDADREVYAWATDEPGRVHALKAMGVDALMCDDPGRALAALAENR